MIFTQAEITSWIGTYMWTFFRIGAVLAIAPVISMQMVPVRVRLAFAIALTIVIAPVIPPVPSVDPVSLAGVLITFQQIFIGMVMGFILLMVFAAVMHAGQLIAMQMGLGFASMVDPQNGVSVPMLSQFYIITATLIYLVLDGHLMVIEVLVDSFHILPISVSGLTAAGMIEPLEWGSRIFSGALQIALPAISALLFVNIAFGIMNRAVPQLNLLSIGFPISMLCGFMAVLVSIPQLGTHVQHLFDDALTVVHQLLLAGAG
jgi:flagellar biosynthesis protein FliR